jgi:hypothetical protein
MLRTNAGRVIDHSVEKRFHLSPLLHIAYASCIARKMAQTLVRPSPENLYAPYQTA